MNNQNFNNTKIKEETNRTEKKIIIYLITIWLILCFISIFFIHNIVDRPKIQGSDSDTDSTTIEIDVIPEKKETQPEIVDYSDRIRVKQGDTDFSELKELDIFKNEYFKEEAIIAPGIEGKYNFVVENETPANFKYKIKFEEQNPYNINMVFKIKKNGTYIFGSENEYVDYEKLEYADYFLGSNKTDLYTVEWKWEDAENDTEIGKTENAQYKMLVDVTAEQEM